MNAMLRPIIQGVLKSGAATNAIKGIISGDTAQDVAQAIEGIKKLEMDVAIAISDVVRSFLGDAAGEFLRRLLMTDDLEARLRYHVADYLSYVTGVKQSPNNPNVLPAFFNRYGDNAYMISVAIIDSNDAGVSFNLLDYELLKAQTESLAAAFHPRALMRLIDFVNWDKEHMGFAYMLLRERELAGDFEIGHDDKKAFVNMLDALKAVDNISGGK